ncbi:NAD(P)-dependent oxidoreductase [Devosia salina]|uniref:Hydroxyacid dehydrogenase n=1 Tax=Devosia salina TaxID=2860336 RepID=A0ABX8WF82_9HYPH|nr:NAD(P)-dependent oxidoreductase [Devosia salina]QYO75636.1 hydroxyacid dehydrogenase [Devosia salina]
MAKVLLPHPLDDMILLYGRGLLDRLDPLASLVLNEDGRHWSAEEVIDRAGDCDVILSFGVTPAGSDLFAALQRLRAFMRWAVDIRNIDVTAASAAGVLVTRGPAAFASGVSELILGLMLDLTRGIATATESYRRGVVPAPAITRDLRGAKLGVIGYGQIARYLCEVAQALGMRILVNDPYTPVEGEGIVAVDRARLLAESDYVVCLATATPETENMMDAAAFAAMKPTAYFINVSRGNLVNEADLKAALDAGTIAGAGLDVGRAHRQMPSLELARHPRVVATPHIGGLTPNSLELQHDEAARQLQAILAGTMPERAVNPAQATRLDPAWRA